MSARNSPDLTSTSPPPHRLAPNSSRPLRVCKNAPLRKYPPFNLGRGKLKGVFSLGTELILRGGIQVIEFVTSDNKHGRHSIVTEILALMIIHNMLTGHVLR